MTADADATGALPSVLYLVDKIQVSPSCSSRTGQGSARKDGSEVGFARTGERRRATGCLASSPRNLSEEVYSILRPAILSQEIEPGARLLEAELATELGVSRAPVREAMRMLEHEGLLESLPRRGATVVSVPEDEIQMFYELRAEIEAKAFARAATRITDGGARRRFANGWPASTRRTAPVTSTP